MHQQLKNIIESIEKAGEKFALSRLKLIPRRNIPSRSALVVLEVDGGTNYGYYTFKNDESFFKLRNLDAVKA
jgi:hypothetical protein